MGWATRQQNISSSTSAFSAARHALSDNQGHLPVYKQLVTTPIGLKKVTRFVIERGMLGQYQRARGLLYPPGPLAQPSTELDYNLGTARNSDLQG
jgi:hypothetical protein